MEPVITKRIGRAIRVGYSGKMLGNVQESAGPSAAANFAQFVSKFPGKTAYDMPAVGKDKIALVDGLTARRLWDREADALITHKSDTLLVLRSADCAPLAFYVPGRAILALAHVGTSGAKLHLPRKVVSKMGVPAEDIHVYIGPHVSQESYCFPSKDIDDKELDSSWRRYISDEADGIHIDLMGYVLDELHSVGVKPENIQMSEVDSGANPNYFSHRRHKISGEPSGRNCFAACLI